MLQRKQGHTTEDAVTAPLLEEKDPLEELYISDDKEEQIEEPQESQDFTGELYHRYVSDLFLAFPYRRSLPFRRRIADPVLVDHADDDHLHNIIKKLAFDPIPVLQKQLDDHKLETNWNTEHVPSPEKLKAEAHLEHKSGTGDEHQPPVPMFDMEAVSLAEFSQKYQLILDYQARFAEICAHNHITDQKQKDALKLFFEKLKLTMMVIFLIMIAKEQGEADKKKHLDEEVGKKITSSLVFALTSKAVLFSEGMEGFLGTTELLTAGDPYMAAVSLLIGGVCAAFNYYMRYTTEIVPQQEAVESHILPQDVIYRAQMHVAQGINNILLKEQSNFKQLPHYIEYSNFAKKIHSDVDPATKQRKKDFPEIKESRWKKVKRYVAAIGSAGVRAPFVFFTVSEGTLGFLALLAFFGVTSPPGWFFIALPIIAGIIAAGVGIFVYRQMKKNFKTELNPEIAERDETREAMEKYTAENHKMPTLVHENIVQKIQTEMKELTQALKAELQSVQHAKSVQEQKENPSIAGQLFTARITEQVVHFKDQLHQLEQSCAQLDRKEFHTIFVEFNNFHKGIDELAKQNNALIARDLELIENAKAAEAIQQKQASLVIEIKAEAAVLRKAISLESKLIQEIPEGKRAGVQLTNGIANHISEFRIQLEALQKKNQNLPIAKQISLKELDGMIQDLEKQNIKLIEKDNHLKDLAIAAKARADQEHKLTERQLAEARKQIAKLKHDNALLASDRSPTLTRTFSSDSNHSDDTVASSDGESSEDDHVRKEIIAKRRLSIFKPIDTHHPQNSKHHHAKDVPPSPYTAPAVLPRCVGVF